MIQELMFGGSSSSSSSSTLSAYSTGGGEGKALINNNGGMVAEATKNPSDSSNDGNKCNLEQNLRCPRCDSSNTKFCYYNNYNLTQPRHFCKTCRRYWTKGGALRNVPIGGGCRKNKNSFTTVLPTASKSFTGKHKPYSSSADILLKTGLGNLGLLDPQDSPLHHPVLWPSPPHPHTSHLLAFLRSTQNLNPSNHHLQNSYQAASGFPAMNLLNGQTPLSGLDYHSSSFLRNNSQTLAQHQQVHHQHNEQLGRVDQNSGIQELYQRLKLSTNSNANSCSSGGSHGHMFLGNGVSATSSPSSTRPGPESATVSVGGGSDSGLWNIPAAAWTNDQLPAATNGPDGCHF